MSLKMVFCRNLQRSIFSILLLLLFYSESSYAQCAGADAAITICNVSDPANKTINLFSLLGPGAQPGGTWNNPSQTLAFNPLTSILNAWNIRLSGTYTFVYTVNDPLCADNTSTVTVTIGPFAGVPTAGVACDDDSSFNLFHCFDGTNNPSPQFGGVWTDDSNTGALSGNFLNATLTQLGTFNFTYTIPAVGPCIASQQTVSVTVYPAPKPGIPSHMNYCENDDFSGLTNVNLFDHLTGQDAGGTWSDSGGTSEISGFNDSTINIQNIFNTQGAGEYSFTKRKCFCFGTLKISHLFAQPNYTRFRLLYLTLKKEIQSLSVLHATQTTYTSHG